MATCLSGWLAGSVAVCHSRYCIKTTKPVLKLFRPSGSPIIEAFATPCADTKFQGEPLHRGRLIHGGGKNWRFSTDIAVYLGKRCEIGRWLLWNVNRKSWVPDLLV